MIEVGLAACASVAWGASDFAAGLAARRRSVLAVLAASQCTGLVLAAAVLFVAGTGGPSVDAIAIAAVAGACEALGFAALYAALAAGPMGLVAPVAALGGVVPLGATLLGGGRIGAAAGAGCIVALLAVALVSRERGELVDARAARRGLLLAGLAAASFGTFFLLLDRAADAAPFLWGVAIARGVAVALVLPALAAMLWRRDRAPGRPSRRETVGLLAIGTLDIAANLLFAWGASRSDGPLVAVVGSTYPVVTVLLAAGVLGERLDRVQRFGVVLALVATALLGM